MGLLVKGSFKDPVLVKTNNDQRGDRVLVLAAEGHAAHAAPRRAGRGQGTTMQVPAVI